MIKQNSLNHLKEEAQKDFYKFELLKMGYFKTTEGLQLYELSLDELKTIYESKSKDQVS